MSDSLRCTVHSAVIEPVPVDAVANGETVTAMIDRLVIELVPAGDTHDHGHTFRLPVTSAANRVAQVARYRHGATVTLTLTAEEGAAQ